MRRERVMRCAGDRGAMLVEAAFVFPLFLTLLFGVIDIGNAEFQTSQATAAARDGARVGILHFDSADVNGSSDRQLIVDQVSERLAGQTATVAVSCISGLTGSTTLSCALAEPDKDRIRVTVSWTYNALTPVMAQVGPQNISGTATMAILGQPTALPTTTTTTTVPGSTTTTSTPPGSCIVNSLTISASGYPPILIKSNGQLENATTFNVTTNDAATCTGLKIQVPNGAAAISLTPGGGALWSTTVPKNNSGWTAGQQPVLVQSSNGTTLSDGSFVVTVVVP